MRVSLALSVHVNTRGRRMLIQRTLVLLQHHGCSEKPLRQGGVRSSFADWTETDRRQALALQSAEAHKCTALLRHAGRTMTAGRSCASASVRLSPARALGSPPASFNTFTTPTPVAFCMGAAGQVVKRPWRVAVYSISGLPLLGRERW